MPVTLGIAAAAAGLGLLAFKEVGFFGPLPVSFSVFFLDIASVKISLGGDFKSEFFCIFSR